MTIIVTKDVSACRTAVEHASDTGVVVVNGVDPVWGTAAFRNLALPDGWRIVYLEEEVSFENAIAAALQ